MIVFFEKKNFLQAFNIFPVIARFSADLKFQKIRKNERQNQ